MSDYNSLPKRILMIDDDLTMCDFVGAIVVAKGFEYYSFNRYDGALKQVKELKPDLVLLDLHLPDGSGLNLCQYIKEDPEFSSIPVIMLTTREFNIEREIAMKNGAEAFLHKPIDQKKLADIIVDTLSPEVKVVFWGVRGSAPCANKENMIYGGNTTCVQLQLPNTENYLILDSGSGIRNLGSHIMAKKKHAEGQIFITHPHWDHIQGFPFFKPFYVPDNKFTVHLPQQLGGDCRDVLAGQMTYTYFPVTPEMLMADIQYETQSYHLQQYDGYKIEFMLSNHPVATAIYKVHVGGKKIVFCPDNELVPASNGIRNSFYDHLLEFFDGADLLIHDAQYSRETYPSRRNWGHSAWEEAVELAAKTHVKHLYLNHHDPDSSDNYLAKLDSELAPYSSQFESIQFAKEGEFARIKINPEL